MDVDSPAMEDATRRGTAALLISAARSRGRSSVQTQHGNNRTLQTLGNRDRAPIAQEPVSFLIFKPGQLHAEGIVHLLNGPFHAQRAGHRVLARYLESVSFGKLPDGGQFFRICPNLRGSFARYRLSRPRQ